MLRTLFFCRFGILSNDTLLAGTEIHSGSGNESIEVNILLFIDRFFNLCNASYASINHC